MGVTVKVEKSRLRGTISVPPSKSYSHRALFGAGLGDGVSTLHNVLNSRDIWATMEAVRALGAEITRIDESTLKVRGVGGKIDFVDDVIYAGNSGTTRSIITSIASLDKKEILIDGDGSLNKRPANYLVEALRSNGAKITVSKRSHMDQGKLVVDEVTPLVVKGPIRGGEIHVNGSKSSQYISGFMFAVPQLSKGADIIIGKNSVSKPYLDMTVQTMRAFGVKVDVQQAYRRYTLRNQLFRPADFVVPSDSSSMALILSAAVLAGEEVTILEKGSKLPQGDRAILDILRALDVRISVIDGEIRVPKIEYLSAGTFDLNNTPDLLIPVAILALKSQGSIEIFNVEHARNKEIDRIDALALELRKVGMNVNQSRDGIVLRRNGSKLKGSNLNSYGDHRMFMALTIVGMYLGNTTVEGAEAVNVSYPNFIGDIQKLGGDIKEIARAN